MIEAVQNLEGNIGVGTVKEKYAPKYLTFREFTGTDLSYEIKNVDTSNVEDMNNMFFNATKLKSVDISGWDTSNVTNMSNMFFQCINLKDINIEGIDTSNVTDMSYMFAKLNGFLNKGINDGTKGFDLSNLDTSNVTNMKAMFMYLPYCKFTLKGKFNTSKVTDMSSMFNSSTNYNFDLSNFDTSNVKKMNAMFSSITGLQEVDLSSFDTSNVEDMSSMFSGCLNIKTINIGNFDTSNVTNIYQIFYRCQSLTSLPELNAAKMISIGYAFDQCNKLSYMGGLKNLGQAYLTTTGANNSNYKLSLSSCTLLTEQSLINVLNNLYDIKTKGCKTQQVVLGATNLNKLTSDEGKLALSNASLKGWSVS